MVYRTINLYKYLTHLLSEYRYVSSLDSRLSSLVSTPNLVVAVISYWYYNNVAISSEYLLF